MKSAEITGERRRRDRWHFTCYETMQLITTLPCVLTHKKPFEQVEIDHVAKRNSCRVSAVNHPRAGEETQMTSSAGPCSRLILTSSPLRYCMWEESVSERDVCLHQTAALRCTCSPMEWKWDEETSRFVPVPFT